MATQQDRDRIARRNFVHWVSCANGYIPEHAVIVVSANGVRNIVARAQHGGGLIPGKVIPGQAQCLIGTCNKEYPVNQYEVLVDPMGALVWIPFTPESMSYAVWGGHREKKPDNTLYVARASINGILTPGKQFKDDRHCSVPFNGGEHPQHTFDILVYN